MRKWISPTEQMQKKLEMKHHSDCTAAKNGWHIHKMAPRGGGASHKMAAADVNINRTKRGKCQVMASSGGIRTFI